MAAALRSPFRRTCVGWLGGLPDGPADDEPLSHRGDRPRRHRHRQRSRHRPISTCHPCGRSGRCSCSPPPFQARRSIISTGHCSSSAASRSPPQPPSRHGRRTSCTRWPRRSSTPRTTLSSCAWRPSATTMPSGPPSAAYSLTHSRRSSFATSWKPPPQTGNTARIHAAMSRLRRAVSEDADANDADDWLHPETVRLFDELTERGTVRMGRNACGGHRSCHPARDRPLCRRPS